MENLGVENVRAFATAAAKTGTAAYGVFEDGKVDFTDLKYIPKVLSGIKGFTAVNYKEVLPELDDLSDDEKESLSAHFKTVFSIGGGSTEEIIEEGYGYILMAIQALFTFIDLGEKVKANAEA